MKTKKLNAVMTIEMSVIIPVILFTIMGLILTVFYFHDKNILNSTASEAAIVGSASLRETGELKEEELESFFRERIQGKCIFLVNHKIDVTVSETEVQVDASAAKRNFSISVMKKATVTEPEEKIRDIRRVMSIDGKKDYD